METVIISKVEFAQMIQKLKILRNSKIYQRLLEFERNILQGKIYIRNDLGF